MTKGILASPRQGVDEGQFESLSDEDRVLALHLLAASRELQRAVVRELRDTDLPRVMGLAGIDLVEPAALEQARRWTMFRLSLLDSEAYSYRTLSELRNSASEGSVRTWVMRRRKEMRMFTVTDSDRTIIPAFQLDSSGEPRSDIAPLLAELLPAGVDGWELWAWLTSATPLLSGDVPEAVAASDSGRALTAAKRFAARR